MKHSSVQSRRFRLLIAAITLVIVLAVSIPTAIIVSILEKPSNDMAPKSNVIVPLYVYPAPGAWNPLHQVISAYPSLNFTIIINPNSGPGAPGSIPDANYTQEIPKLTSHANVQVLGYVHTNYTKRDISEVLQDVETYAEWAENATIPGLAVKGIFFDESPNQYDPGNVTYLEDLTKVVKGKKGLGPNNTVIHNPGSVPDRRYLPSADTTVVFEDTYQMFQYRHGANILAEIPGSNRTQRAAVMHAVPSLSRKDFQALVKQVRRVADMVFMTDLVTNYYADFGSKLVDFCEAMAA